MHDEYQACRLDLRAPLMFRVIEVELEYFARLET
jgi:hypothetical protein